MKKPKPAPMCRQRVPKDLWEILMLESLRGVEHGFCHVRSKVQADALSEFGLKGITSVGLECPFLDDLLKPDIAGPDYILSLNVYEYMPDAKRIPYLVKLSSLVDRGCVRVYLAYTNPKLIKSGRGTQIRPERYFKHNLRITDEKNRLTVLELYN